MTMLDHKPQSPLTAQIAVLTAKNLRLLAGIGALINQMDSRDDYAGLTSDELSVLDQLRAMDAEARS